jgi:hypothetical protein
MAQNQIDQEKTEQIRKMLANENEAAVAQRYGEAELGSEEFRAAQRSLDASRQRYRTTHEQAIEDAVDEQLVVEQSTDSVADDDRSEQDDQQHVKDEREAQADDSRQEADRQEERERQTEEDQETELADDGEQTAESGNNRDEGQSQESSTQSEQSQRIAEAETNLRKSHQLRQERSQGQDRSSSADDTRDPGESGSRSTAEGSSEDASVQSEQSQPIAEAEANLKKSHQARQERSLQNDQGADMSQ